ncbi:MULTISPECIES: Fic family protein [unclassified Mycolicibacterium]|uniref:Fic family protein n=1 Tax=unclassified Mycolicibacterium TaxID=2636767 RepID=UPI0013068170|nr:MULTISPECIES: Fic family protein [unclassified Mycolicibacterium]MUL80811.1 cell filamentation protein Fic [Mycolicibacterium sp. CBMA 329]MUL86578.1 cell filamentation protein Fic [Mycolicibacterium sp. CBMA 331]MUM01439.1 cell filamentation protein Fic [Mycolicibacterium sp. CBMA 334]MUM27243.1 cell filamentation protein Fic [Mycolicibacterium sp. CBMA 295]MUM36874.1 cell filamentation protein Fic [Mycolicibacterium sp. CBMA 247]
MVAEPSEPGRHALAQTIAAERLEGWQPTAEQTEDLTALLTGGVTFGEYLGRHLPDPAPPLRRRVFARRRPYFIPGTSVLRNNFGVRDAGVLAQLEFVATAGRILQAHLRTQDRDLDVRSLHQHLFGDVYAWAGEPRIVELRKGDSSFGSCARIPPALDALHVEIGRLADDGTEIDDGTLSYRLARIYADYNQIHPFREGNGRTGTVLLHLLAGRAGRRLLLDDISRSEWVDASRDSMPFRRDGCADPRPFMAVLRGRLQPQPSPEAETTARTQ